MYNRLKANELKMKFSEKSIIKTLIKLSKEKFLKKINIHNYKFNNEFFRKWITIEIGKTEIKKYYKEIKNI